jgi:WD40 repeat protein
VWDATSGQQTRVLKHGANWVRRLAFTADSTALLVGAEAIDEKEGKFGGAFSMWNIDTGAIVYQVPLPERVTTIALSHDGRQVAVATGKPTSDPGEPRPPRIHVFSVAAGEKLTEINARPGLIQSIGWSPDDSVVVAACDDNTIRRLEVASGRELSTHATRHEREDMGRIVETALASAALLGDDSTVLTTGSSANDAHAWDLTTGESIWMLHGKWSYIHQMAIAPNARIVALHQRDSRRSRSYLTLWDVAMRRELMQIDVGKEFVQAMAFSPDGKRIVTGLDSGNALVWDVAAASETLGGESSDTSNRKKSIP